MRIQPLLLAVVLIGCNSKQPPEIVKANPTPSVKAEQLVDALEKKLLADTIGFNSLDDGILIVRAVDRKDRATIAAARDRGKMTVLKKDTRFLIQDYDSTKTFMKVYVTSGSQFGETLWLIPGSKYWDAQPPVTTAPKTN